MLAEHTNMANGTKRATSKTIDIRGGSQMGYKHAH